MKRIKCACLVKKENNKLLLVRVRDNQHWYLPGGKIEKGEIASEALKREISEELNIKLIPKSIQYLYTVTGPAYNEKALVDLVCFSADWEEEIQPKAEISEVDWIECKEENLLAPAVLELIKSWD
ncbi:NUDIX hydrolase [Bacillus cereus]|uniref:NUDIX hydrolase n=1 Tax=Bacillus cereus TaxID=1396 RepID=UPI00187965F4|nr:NUDIX domain-containing protein [Bacillus cereus]MBE7097451.1 NUDIX domain-containing protein [Bacillus cereus]